MTPNYSIISRELNSTGTVIILIGIIIVLWCCYEFFISYTIDTYQKEKTTLSKKILIFYLKFCAFFDRGEVVSILSNSGKVLLTVSYKLADTEDRIAFAYFRSKIGHLLLHPNGKISTLGYNSMQAWLPIDREKRTWMILQGAKGFDY